MIAFKDGRPAAQFMGAIPEGQVREFFDKLLPSASELALARAEGLFGEGKFDEAEAELAKVKSDPDWDARLKAVRQGIAYARAGKGGPGEAELKAKLAANPADHDARAALAALYAGKKHYREALDELLEIVRRAKDWKPELVGEYRRKLASTLY